MVDGKIYPSAYMPPIDRLILETWKHLPPKPKLSDMLGMEYLYGMRDGKIGWAPALADFWKQTVGRISTTTKLGILVVAIIFVGWWTMPVSQTFLFFESSFFSNYLLLS